MDNIERNKKVLFVATVDSHIINFHTPYLKLLRDNGYEVHVCTGEDGKIPFCDKKHSISITRSPYRLGNIKAIKQLRNIINMNNYEFIHCHTPMGGVVTRLAAKEARQRRTKVLYTAHGFHFYKGAPILNWLIYYPIEKWLSKYTDILITINEEDYNIARNKFKKIKNIKYVNGVGLDTTKFDIKITDTELEQLRKSIGINKDNIVLTYVAELNKNKNQILLLKAIQELIKENKEYRLILVGDGDKRQEYEEYILQHNLEEYVKILGRREDIPQILNITDIYVASSLREGLPVNILEAMYMDLPIIATDNRGHRELIKDDYNGCIINNNTKKLKNKIVLLTEDKSICDRFKIITEKDIKKYKLERVREVLKEIYMLK